MVVDLLTGHTDDIAAVRAVPDVNNGVSALTILNAFYLGHVIIATCQTLRTDFGAVFII
jgi:hypothetical protein